MPLAAPQEARVKSESEASAQLRLQLSRKDEASTISTEYTRSHTNMMLSALYEMGGARIRQNARTAGQRTQLDERRTAASPSAMARAR